MQLRFWLNILILFCIAFCGIQCNKYTTPPNPVCIKGVVVLKKNDFDRYKRIFLKGEWEFYPNELLTPDDFTKKNIPIPISYIRIPILGNKTVINGEKIKQYGYGTCRLRLILPPNQKKIGLYFTSFRTMPNRVWINGSDVTDDFQNVRNSFDRYFDIFQDTSEIIYHLTLFKDGDNDRFKKLIPISYVVTRNFLDLDTKIQLFVCGALFIMAIYNITFYILHRKNRASLYLGILSISMAFIFINPFDPVFSRTFGFLQAYFYFVFLNSLLQFKKSTIFAILAYVFHSFSIFCIIFSILLPNQWSNLSVYLNVICILFWGYIFYLFLIALIRRTNFTSIPFIVFTIIIPLHYFFQVFILRAIALPQSNLLFYFVYYFNPFLFIICMSLFLASRFAVASKAAEAMNERLLKVDKLKDEFLANTSHELRTPIAGMIGIAQLILDDKQPTVSSRQADNLRMIINSGKRLSNLINDILDFSKIRNNDLSLHIRPIELRNIIDVVFDLCRPMVENRKIVLRNLITLSLPAVNADENRLQQILYNLIGNAVKFTHEGNITVSALHTNGYISVSIADTGIGIAPEHLHSLFIPFSQEEKIKNTNYGGTGLGLSITKHLVELMGGAITVESIPNKGSVFTFTLPEAVEKDTTTSSRHQLEERGVKLEEKNVPVQTESIETCVLDNEQQKNKTVLVVDDESVNLFYIENQLVQEGFKVLTAQDGESALQRLQQQRPDAILLDLMIPKMNGFEVCRRIRETYHISDLPVIIITAMNQTLNLVNALKAGANDYITKFCTKEELLARLNTHIQIVDAIQKVREIKAEVVRAGQLTCTGELAAGVAHEVLTPITTIMLNAQNLIESGSIGNDELEYGKMIYHEANRINTIVKSLLTFARVGNEEKKLYSIHEVIKQTMALINTQTKKEGIRFELHIADGLPDIFLNFSKMQQVFMNLFSNARYAIRHKYESNRNTEGIIRFSAIHQSHEPHNIKIIFEDNGCGISSRYLNKVLNPFFTTKPAGQGTGLGLSICHGIITDHGGTLEVESTENEYTRIIINLPVYIKEN